MTTPVKQTVVSGKRYLFVYRIDASWTEVEKVAQAHSGQRVTVLEDFDSSDDTVLVEAVDGVRFDAYLDELEELS